MKNILSFVALLCTLSVTASCGEDCILRIKRPKFEQADDNSSRNDTISEDVDFNDPFVPDEYVGQDPDDIPEEVVAVEEESL